MPITLIKVISSSAKPHSGAEKITLVANGVVVLSGTSALYNADGEAVEGTTFTANGNTVDVILPINGVPAGKYTVALGKDTTVAGLEKDLFLPFKQQTTKLSKGDKCLVSLYVDKSERLCATMKVYELLSKESPYQKDDMVEGVVYGISQEFGVFVAVDGKYTAMIPKKEAPARIRIGQTVEARVTSVKADGKLDLSVREKAHVQMDKDAEMIWERLQEYNGKLPFNDKADPEIIKREFDLSKNAFKRAVGRLLKEEKITINEKSIEIRSK